jgi:hypothetical protein
MEITPYNNHEGFSWTQKLGPHKLKHTESAEAFVLIPSGSRPAFSFCGANLGFHELPDPKGCIRSWAARHPPRMPDANAEVMIAQNIPGWKKESIGRGERI